MTDKRLQFALLLFILLILSGCSSLTPMDPPRPTATETALPDDEGGDLETEDPTATPAPEITPVVPPSEAVSCLPPSEHPDLAYTNYQEFPQAILDYLNGGASPEELAVWLIVNGLGPEEQPVWAEDLTGDGFREVAATVYDEQEMPQGAMLIYNCVDGQYVLEYLAVSDQGALAPKMQHIQDINADGLREAVYSSTNCGAHTCFEDLHILEWENGEYIQKLEGSTLDYPYPEVKLTDFDHDGIYTLEVTGTSIASVGAGPQRDSINNWDYDPTQGIWRLKGQSLAASPFRIHVVHDADAAMEREEYLIASLLFEQVVEDEGLLEWASPEQEYANLAAYAYYKRIVSAVFQGDRAGALALYDELEAEYGDKAQYGYVEMADAFLEDSELLGTEGGCTAAREYAASHESLVLEPLGSATYGYANPDYEPADMCP